MFQVEGVADFDETIISNPKNSDKDEQKEEEENKTKYLFFRKGEILLTKNCFENGWWYGEKQEDEGYFPSNFVRVVEDEKEKITENSEKKINEINKKNSNNWMDYAKSYIDNFDQDQANFIFNYIYKLI